MVNTDGGCETKSMAPTERYRFDVARVLISTHRMGIIDEWLRIRVMGAVFKIWVVEDTKAWPRHSWWKELMSFEEGMGSN
jgi:hypothetical protein